MVKWLFKFGCSLYKVPNIDVKNNAIYDLPFYVKLILEMKEAANAFKGKFACAYYLHPFGCKVLSQPNFPTPMGVIATVSAIK